MIVKVTCAAVSGKSALSNNCRPQRRLTGGHVHYTRTISCSKFALLTMLPVALCSGEFHLGYSRSDISGLSWYNLVHWENLREAQSKHRLITQSEQEKSCILLLRMETLDHRWIWVHVVLQVKDSTDSSQQSVIVCTNQVLR